MRIWLLTSGEPIPSYPPVPHERILRTGQLFLHLRDGGHEVTWWTSRFDHFSKKDHPSDVIDTWASQSMGIRFLQSPGYSSNRSAGRVFDHWAIAREFLRRSLDFPAPEIILCSLPTPDLCSAASAYCRRARIPLVVDIRDLWPDAFQFGANLKAKVVSPLFTRMRHQSAAACMEAEGLVAPSQAFLDWGLSLARRDAGPNDGVIPFGHPGPLGEASHEDRQFWSHRGISLDGDMFLVVFSGTLTVHFDFDPLGGAAEMLHDRRPNAAVVCCGDGPQLGKLQRKFRQLGNMLFPGRVNGRQLSALLASAQVGLAPYVVESHFESHLPNKIVEYCAHGVPVLSSLRGVTQDLLRTEGIGLTYGLSPGDLSRKLGELMDDTTTLRQMGSNALSLFKRSYKASTVNEAFEDHLSRVVSSATQSGK